MRNLRNYLILTICSVSILSLQKGGSQSRTVTPSLKFLNFTPDGGGQS